MMGDWDKNMERSDPKEGAKKAAKQEAERIRKQTGGKKKPQGVTKVGGCQERKGGL
jgi:hypothetical protein